MFSHRFAGVVLGCLLLVAAAARGSDWPQFRGPGALSISDEKGLPTTWGADGTNIAWKAALPKADNGYSSPIVCKGRVFLTVALNKPLTHTVLCFDAATGKPLWSTNVDPGPWKLSDLRGGYGAPTPAADSDHVYAFFGSAVIACLDYDGKIVWRKELDNTSFDVAIGTSPVLFDDSLIFQFDQNGKKSYLAALYKKNGDMKWTLPRPEQIYAHATPIIASVSGKPVLVVSGFSALQGVDPASGKKLWSVESSGETVSPAYGDGLVYVDTGRGGGGICVDITGPQPAVKWQSAKSEMGEGFGSPLIVEGLVYKMHRGDLLLCRKAATGEIVFSEHLPQMSSAVSPILTADGLIYFVSGQKSYVIKPGTKLQIVAKSDLDDGNDRASAAIAEGHIFVRGNQFLHCIGKKSAD